MDFVATFLRRRLAYTYEVVELTPGKRLAHAHRARAVPDGDVVRWEPAGESGHPDDVAQPRRAPPGSLGWSPPFMARQVRRANTKDLANLKRLLERT